MKANKHPKLSCFWIMVTHWPRAAVMKCQPQGVQDVAACESSFCKGLVCTFSFGLWQVVADGDRDHLIHVHGIFDLAGNGMTRTGNASCLSISRDVGPNGLAMGYKEVSVFLGFAVHPASFRDFRMPLAPWQMLDADGWCLMMVLYMVLSDILAERRMARRTQVRWKGCFTFTGASLADSGLLQVGLFLWWLCMLSFLSFFIWERTGELKREGGEGAEKDSMHTSRHRKNATEDDSNLPHTPAS